MNKELSKKLKDNIYNIIYSIKDDEVALLLSAGIDSRALLFALLECGKKVHAYTFHLENTYSRDYLTALDICNTFGVEFTEVTLSTNIEQTQNDLLYIIPHFKLSKKTDIECTWAMFHTIPKIKERTVIAGLGCDGHFVISKKGMIHYRDTVEKMNEFRSSLFSNPNYSQNATLTEYCKYYDKTIISPFLNKNIIELFKDTSWQELNTPHEKQIILDMFPTEFKRNPIYRHTNFQKGDSGITQHFEKLLATNWNRGKSVTSIYNAIKRNEITTI